MQQSGQQILLHFPEWSKFDFMKDELFKHHSGEKKDRQDEQTYILGKERVGNEKQQQQMLFENSENNRQMGTPQRDFGIVGIHDKKTKHGQN